MSERYTRVFTLTEDLYSEGSPVIIRAGALLKDNTNGMVLAQLKFENVSSKAIKALTVSIQPLDVKGSPIGETVTHQYLDLNQKRDSQFASKEAVLIPNAMTRSFTVFVAEVVFSDSAYWTYSGAEWKQLQKPASLTSAWEEELIKQYHLENGYKGYYFYKELDDLWYCHCGALNRTEEANCHKCGMEQNSIKNLDVDGLKVRMVQRLEEEQKAEEERLRVEEEKKIKAEQEKIEAERIRVAQRKKKKKKIKIASAIIVPLMIVTVLVLTAGNIVGYHYAQIGDYEMTAKVVFASHIAEIFNKEFVAYANASKLLVQGNYEAASKILTSIPGFSNSTELKNETDYLLACQLLNDEKFEDAKTIFTKLSEIPYKDSDEKINEVVYQYSLSLLEEDKDLEIAIENFALLSEAEYENSSEMLSKAEYQLCKGLFEQGKLLESFKSLQSINKSAETDVLLDQVIAALYDEGVEKYHNQELRNAEMRFSCIPEYRDSSKYLLLIHGRDRLVGFPSENALKERNKPLLEIIDFEDAGYAFLNGCFGISSLCGNWRTSNGNQYLYFAILDDDTYIFKYATYESNIPGIIPGNIDSLHDGILNDVLKIKLISKNTIEVQCLADGIQYIMYRN